MKRIFAAIITAFLLSAGLVATSSSPAAAECPYTDCAPTATFASNAGAGGAKTARLKIEVTSFGNGRPRGRLEITFIKRNGNAVTFDRAYSGKKVYRFSPLPKGKYTAIVNFVPSADSVYQGSGSAVANVKVKGQRRR